MRKLWRIWLTLLLVISGWLPVRGERTASAQEDGLLVQAQQMMAAMTIDQRVGQLFLVTFTGDSAPNDSDIAALITEFHVGGVVLLRQNDNITGYGNPEETAVQLTQLSNDLQRLALTGISTAPLLESDIEEGTLPPTRVPPPPETAVPVFIAINQEGDGFPFSHIHAGLTQIPNNMAIGATWNPNYSRVTGSILGEELAAVGINMLLGPSLDVLEDPDPSRGSNLGVRSFGGDPYWVGVMGKAYTEGVHAGSNGRIAVIPKHFPGNGDSDRPIDVEIPTVRKSLEQLKQIELAPFFAVTNGTANQPGIADGLLTTHIRYQGFQGNIRDTTNPVSFDPQALATLMALSEFSGWQASGGIIVSDALGVRSVERFYDVTEQEFPHRRVAKDALLAGNDLLYLSSFALGNPAYDVQLANIKDTIRWFQEKYLTDQTFQQRVDTAVLRILRLKLQLYGADFGLENVLTPDDALRRVQSSHIAPLLELAQSAVTLIAPSPAELAERTPRPPGPNDRIVIFTDIIEAQQCTTCPRQPLIAETAVAERIVALYGPQASEQIRPEQVASFSFADLQAFLDADGPLLPPPTATATAVPQPDATETPETLSTATPAPTPAPSPAYLVQEALRDANWIIFSQLDTIGPTALNNFLAERPDLVRDTQLIVFSFGAPYQLDTTEISKLSAYYGIYSKTEPFIDAAVRALFQELPLTGKSPVDISGISYDLFKQTQPDPNQIIELFLVTGNTELSNSPNQEPQQLFVGDTMRLQTGIIRDRNGNPVPDGTLVQFLQLDRVEGLINIIQEVPTSNGVASLDYLLEARTGQFRITAVSGEAILSREVDIAIEGEEQVAISIPTLVPTPTPAPTATSSATPSPTMTITPEPTATPSTLPSADEPVLRIGLSTINMLMALLAGLLTTATLGLLYNRQQPAPLSVRVRGVLWGLIAALVFYNYFVLQLPGTAVIAGLGAWAGLIATLIGGAIGLTVVFWTQRQYR